METINASSSPQPAPSSSVTMSGLQNHNRRRHHHQQRDNSTNGDTTIESLESSPASALNNTTHNNNDYNIGTANNTNVVYDVEHLATFSTNSNQLDNRTTASENDNDDDISDGNNTKSGSGLGKGSSTTPKVALQRLFELEKLSGIWTQHMQIELRDDFMLIVDCETNSTVERFHRDCVTRPEAFNHYNDIYNNIVVFIIQQLNNDNTNSSSSNDNILGKDHGEILKGRRQNSSSRESDIADENYQDFRPSGIEDFSEGELHIFQCVSHKAQQLVSNILIWKSQQSSNNPDMANSSSNQPNSTSKQSQNNSPPNRAASSGTSNDIKTVESKIPTSSAAQSSAKPVVTVASSTNNSKNVPLVNVNVKETVQVFNQIAALREKSKPNSPTNHTRPLSDASGTSAHSTPAVAVAGSTGAAAAATTTNTNGGATDQARSPLSPGSQLYKQRSIRATLAPKYASGSSPATSEQPSPAHSTKMEPQQQQQHQQSSSSSSSNNSGSAASSSSSMDLADPKLAYHLAGSQGSSRQQETSNLRDAIDPGQPMKKSAGGGSGSSSGPNQVTSPGHHHQHQPHHHHHRGSKSKTQQQAKTQSDSTRSHASSSSQSHLDQVTTNESYVSVLNHCFDDIEKFIIRLQQVVAAFHELQAKRKLSKRASNLATANGKGGEPGVVSSPPITAAELSMLSSKARGPSEDDYFEILSKFKLAFNLLAKLKGCIHEPNAPELVHFLFTPLAIIIESARNATPPIDPTLVGIPYLNQDALDLLSNCCTSKESDMWLSLGPNWTQTIDMNLLKASRLPSSFQPIFSDGWAPIIGELELIGLVATSSMNSMSSNEQTVPAAEVIDSNNHQRQHHHHHRLHPSHSHDGRRGGGGNGIGAHQAYLLDDGGGPSAVDGYSLEHPPSFSNGKTRGGLDHTNVVGGRDYNKRISGPPQPPINRHQSGPMEPLAPQQPYLDQMNHMPYGYPLDHPAMSPLEREMPGHRLSVERGLRNIRFSANGALEGQAPRRMKQSSRYQDYSMASNYDTSHYPPPVDGHLVDVDLLAQHQNGSALHHHHHHSDEYTELQEHYVDDGGHKGLPGSSQQHYRAGNDRNRHQHNGGSGGSGGGRHKSTFSTTYNRNAAAPLPYEKDYSNEADHEAMLLDLGPAQTEWFYELQSRGAMIVRVLFARDANNDKELSVRRGEILEVLDDTRKWWRARNIQLQVAHVPHTIVAVMQGYQTLDELLANSPGNLDEPSLMNSQRYSRHNLPSDSDQHQWQADKRNSKVAGAFRYF